MSAPSSLHFAAVASSIVVSQVYIYTHSQRQGDDRRDWTLDLLKKRRHWEGLVMFEVLLTSDRDTPLSRSIIATWRTVTQNLRLLGHGPWSITSRAALLTMTGCKVHALPCRVGSGGKGAETVSLA